MAVVNVHEREIPAAAEEIGALLDSLASRRDGLWPGHSWPRMAFDRPLGVGAIGGHGPIRYSVEEYSPGRSVVFRFSRPRGFRGIHRFDVLGKTPESAILRHTVEMTVHGVARITWPLVIRPLHDALIEDSLATAEASLGLEPRLRRWSLRVKFLRWSLAGGKRRKQFAPGSVGKEPPELHETSLALAHLRDDVITLADELGKDDVHLVIPVLLRRDFDAYLRMLEDHSRGERLPRDWVPHTTYWYLAGGRRLIGAGSVRHRLTPLLEDVGGHINYVIRPGERRKGHGTRLLTGLLAKAREHGLERVLVTTDPDNEASRKIVERNGGVLADEKGVPKTKKARYWIEVT